MKGVASVLLGVFVISAPAAINSALAPASMISNDNFARDTYCHKKFPVIDENRWVPIIGGWRAPTRETIIDHYGRCDGNPSGNDQIDEQELEQERPWEAD